MNALSVRGLCKRYPSFALHSVGFDVPEGSITGFIGRNGAGKTTTLKSLLGFVHPDAGETRFFGKSFAQEELAVKQEVGFVMGGFGFYPLQRLDTITDTARRFYPTWDAEVYRRYCALFALDGAKRVKELSEGMKVKYALALALSHRAKLLILDEPTSGLDPVSREELLEIFLRLTREEAASILFSTHITSDLEKCADRIVYLRRGRVVEDAQTDALRERYRLAQLTRAQADAAPAGLLLGVREARVGVSALVRAQDAPRLPVETAPATLEEIMIHLDREGEAA